MKRIATLICASLSVPASAWADTVCMAVVEMEAALIDWYGEAPVPGAVASDQQLWASEATGTWTLMGLNNDGTACVLGQGAGWTDSDEPLLALQQLLDGAASPEMLAFADQLPVDRP